MSQNPNQNPLNPSVNVISPRNFLSTIIADQQKTLLNISNAQVEINYNIKMIFEMIKIEEDMKQSYLEQQGKSKEQSDVPEQPTDATTNSNSEQESKSTDSESQSKGNSTIRIEPKKNKPTV